MRSQPQLKSLIGYNLTDEKINVCGPERMADLTLDECSKEFQISMAHQISCDKKHENLAEEMQQQFKSKKDHRAVSQFLENPKNYFSIQYLNKTCGYGLVANKNIPAYTVVGIYSGELVFAPEDEKDTSSREYRAYDMNIDRGLTLNGKKYDLTLRAVTHGDCTRFAPHLPNKDDVERLPLNSNIAKNAILTANMEFPMGYVNGIPVRFYRATRAIQKGEICGINYGDGYWQHRGKPALFVKDQDYVRIANFSPESNEYKITQERFSIQLPPKLKPKTTKNSVTEYKPNLTNRPKRKIEETFTFSQNKKTKTDAPHKLNSFLKNEASSANPSNFFYKKPDKTKLPPVDRRYTSFNVR